jgi:hypothetical protein
MNSQARFVMATRTVHPARCNPRKTSAALYAAIPPETQSATRLPVCGVEIAFDFVVMLDDIGRFRECSIAGMKRAIAPPVEPTMVFHDGLCKRRLLPKRVSLRGRRVR